MCYRVIWNLVQLFGDNNTLVHYAHSCVIITKKLHEIPYDTVTHSNSVINPSLHNFLNICDRKSIFVPLPMFSGSGKPDLTSSLQLKKPFLSGCIAPRHIFDYMDVIHVWNWRTLSEMKLSEMYWVQSLKTNLYLIITGITSHCKPINPEGIS